MKKENNKKLLKNYKGFAERWLTFFAIGVVVSAAFMAICYGLFSVTPINDFISNVLKDRISAGETYMGLLSLVFIVTSLVSVLSDKSETIYWASVMDYKLVNPTFFNMVSISAFLAAEVFISTIAIATFWQYVYVCLIVVIVLLFALSMKMLSGFFYRENPRKKLKKLYACSAVISVVDKVVEQHIENVTSGWVRDGNNKFKMNWIFWSSKTEHPKSVEELALCLAKCACADADYTKCLADDKRVKNIAIAMDKLGIYDCKNGVVSVVDNVDLASEDQKFLDNNTLDLATDTTPFVIKWRENQSEYLKKQFLHIYRLKLLKQLWNGDMAKVDACLNQLCDELAFFYPKIFKKGEQLSADEMVSQFLCVADDAAQKSIKEGRKIVDSISTTIDIKQIKKNHQDLISLTMKYVDDVNISRLIENLDLLILCKRMTNVREILTYASAQNAELYLHIIEILNDVDLVKDYTDITEPLMENFIKDHNGAHFIVYYTNRLERYVEKAVTTYGDSLYRYFRDPAYIMEKRIRQNLCEANKQLYDSLEPLNIIIQKMIRNEYYAGLTVVLEDMMKTPFLKEFRIGRPNFTSIQLVLFMVMGRGYSVEKEGLDFDAKLKYWSPIFPETYTYAMKMFNSAVLEGKITTVEEHKLKMLFAEFVRSKAILDLAELVDKERGDADMVDICHYIDNDENYSVGELFAIADGTLSLDVNKYLDCMGKNKVE